MLLRARLVDINARFVSPNSVFALTRSGMESLEGIFEFAGFVSAPRQLGLPFWCSLAVFYQLDDALSIDTAQRHETELRSYCTGAARDRVHLFIVPRSDARNRSSAYTILSPYLRYSSLKYWSGYDLQLSDAISGAFRLADTAAATLRATIQEEISDQNERLKYLLELTKGDGNTAGLAVMPLGFLCIADVLDLRGRASVVIPYATKVARAISNANRIKWDAQWVSAFAKIIHWAALLELQTACLRSVLHRSDELESYSYDEANVYHWLSNKLADRGAMLRLLTGYRGRRRRPNDGDDEMDVDQESDRPVIVLPSVDDSHLVYFQHLANGTDDKLLMKQACIHFLQMRGMWRFGRQLSGAVHVSEQDKFQIRDHMQSFFVPGADFATVNSEALYLSRARKHLDKLFHADDLEIAWMRESDSEQLDIMRFSPINLLQQEFGIFIHSIVTDKTARASPAVLEKSRFARWHQVIQLVPHCLEPLYAAKDSASTHQRFRRLMHPLVHSQILLQSPYQDDPAFYPIPYYVWSLKVRASAGHAAAALDWEQQQIALMPAQSNENWRDARYFGYPYSLQFLSSLFRTGRVCLVDPDPDLWIPTVVANLKLAKSVSTGEADAGRAASFFASIARARHGHQMCVMPRESLCRLVEILDNADTVRSLNMLKFVPSAASVGSVAVLAALSPSNISVALTSQHLMQLAQRELSLLLRPANLEHLQATSLERNLLDMTAPDAMDIDSETFTYVDASAASWSAPQRVQDLTVKSCLGALTRCKATDPAILSDNSCFMRLDCGWKGKRVVVIDLSSGSSMMDSLCSLLRCARQEQLRESNECVMVECVFYPLSGYECSMTGRLARAILGLDTCTRAEWQSDDRLVLPAMNGIPKTPMSRSLFEVMLEMRHGLASRHPIRAAADLFRSLGSRFRLLVKSSTAPQPLTCPVQLSSATDPWHVLCVRPNNLATLDDHVCNTGLVVPVDQGRSLVMQHLHCVKPTGVRMASLEQITGIAMNTSAPETSYFGLSPTALRNAITSRAYDIRHIVVMNALDFKFSPAARPNTPKKLADTARDWHRSFYQLAWQAVAALEQLAFTEQAENSVFESDIEIWVLVDSVSAERLDRYDADSVNVSGRSAQVLVTSTFDMRV